MEIKKNPDLRDKMNEFAELLKIDRNALDEDIITQSEIYYQVSKLFAFAVSKKDQLKEQIVIVDANIDMYIREKDIKKNKDKKNRLTESAIKAEIIANREHDDAVKAHLFVRRDVEELQALKDAFSQRNYMLRELARLFIAGYYQSATVGAERDVVSAGTRLAATKKRKLLKRMKLRKSSKKKKKKSSRERI